MPADKVNTEASRRGRRWAWPAFFVAWTLLVCAAGGWLVWSKPDAQDLLITLNPTKHNSWFGGSRQWAEAHAAMEWTIPWVALAPYVLWGGLRLADARRGRWMWLGCHLAGGAVFVFVSRAVMDRIEKRHPRVIMVAREDIVHEGATDDFIFKTTNAVRITREITWADGETRVEAHATPGATSLVPGFHWPAGTNRAGQVLPGATRVMVYAGGHGPSNAPGSNIDHHFAAAIGEGPPPPGLVSNLFSLIDGQIKSLPSPPQGAGPHKLSTAVDGLAYAALIGLTQAIHFRRRLAAKEKQAMQLESRLVQSQLSALQSQLQPHFLFNALNGIAMLVRRDPRLAEDMIGSLSELLRLSLQQSGKPLITLREEMEFLDRYLEIQQMRFGERLRVEKRTGPGTLDYLVPSLLLQPLVENAVRHGIEPLATAGLLTISSHLREGRIVLQVEDNGVGLAPSGGSGPSGGGLGIANVRERLAGLYPGAHEFELRDKPEGGVLAIIIIPAAEAAA